MGLPNAHISSSRLSGESRNPETSTTLDPGFRRGDVKGSTKTMKNVSMRPPSYVSFWVGLLQRRRSI